MIIDFYDDYGALLGFDSEKIAGEVEKPQGLPKEAYAYPELKKFPIHTKEDAIFSAIYILKQADQLPEYVEKNAYRALEVHNAIPEFEQFLTKVAKKLTYEERNELPDSVFGIPELRKYPMPDAEHVRKAITFFEHAPEEYKPGLAKKILEKANEFGVEVNSEKVLRYAGAVKSDMKKAAEEIRNFRKRVVQDTILQERYEKLASLLENADISQDELQYVIDTIYKLDSYAGIRFSTKPEEIVFAKTAEEKVLMVKLLSIEVPITKIAEIDDETLKALIGFVPTKSNPKLMKDEIESLPDPEKDILEKFIKQ